MDVFHPRFSVSNYFLPSPSPPPGSRKGKYSTQNIYLCHERYAEEEHEAAQEQSEDLPVRPQIFWILVNDTSCYRLNLSKLQKN